MASTSPTRDLLLALGEYVSDLDGLKQTGLRKYLDRNTVDVRYIDDIGCLVIKPYETNGKGKLVSYVRVLVLSRRANCCMNGRKIAAWRPAARAARDF